MQINYNEPIEVTKTQYQIAMDYLKGSIAGKIEDGKYYIKLWVMVNKPVLEIILNKF